MDKTAYLQFLRSKLPVAERAGFEPPSPCHPSLKPHQRDICEWACRGGRRAVFASFGLGKTRMHLQIAQWVIEFSRGALSCPATNSPVMVNTRKVKFQPETPAALTGTRGKYLTLKTTP